MEVSDDGKTVYLAGGGDVFKLTDPDLDGKSNTSVRIIEGLPSFVYDSHSNNGLELGPDGRLYMTLGGTESFGRETHPLAGSILVSNPDGSNLEVFARGLRNPYDLAFTSHGQLIASDNGPERPWDHDELNVIEIGQNYGYPDVFGFPPPWSETTGPITVFPAHSVPTGTIEYQGSNFPSEYRGRIFLSLFGSSVLASKVVAITLDEPKPGVFRGTVDDFVTGLRSSIDVAVDSMGRLYIADFDGRQVYQVSWEGP
jgi:quinoprotein glucose dehydrogenase